MLLGQQTVIRLPSVDSTNNYAAKLIASGFTGRNTVILADEQTHGRGQRGNFWQTEAYQNIIMSWITEAPELPSSQQFLMSKATSLALVDLLDLFGISAQIKWPNDIYAEGKKIAGILIENQLKGKHISHSIIGIGLNVNQLHFPGLEATSLSQITGIKHDLKEVERLLINQLNRRWVELRKKNWEPTHKAYLERFLLLNKRLADNPAMVIKGVSSSGHLVASDGQQELLFAHGEITLSELI